MIQRIPYEVAICDWNGTLLDDLDLVYASVCNIFNHFGIPPPSIETYREEITADFWVFYKKNGIPPDTDPDVLNSIRKKFFRENMDRARLNENTEELLDAFRSFDLEIGIVSGEAKGYLEERLKDMGIRKYFDFVYDGIKDKRKMFAEIPHIYEIPPDKMFYVDDTFDGVCGARLSGLFSFGFAHARSYNSEEKIKKAEPHHLIHSLLEIPPIISEI